MNQDTPEIRALARRMIAREAARAGLPESDWGVAARACETLKVPLARLVGVEGFRSILSRALALAKAKDPALGAALVRPDGTLEGPVGVERTAGVEPGAVIVAELLGLLSTFIGEPLTMRLVRDAWPESASDETDLGGEGRS